MATVTVPLSQFTTSGGVVGADQLQLQIQQDPAITTQYLTLIPASLTAVDLIFASALSPAEQTALDAIVAAHNGLNLPDGADSVLSLCIMAHVGGVAVPSFVDTATASMGTIGMRQERQALGPGRLVLVSLRSDTDVNAATVQLVLNGSTTGPGITSALVAGVGVDFVLPIAEALYAKGNRISLAITGLAAGSDTAIEAAFTEAI